MRQEIFDPGSWMLDSQICSYPFLYERLSVASGFLDQSKGNTYVLIPLCLLVKLPWAFKTEVCVRDHPKMIDSSHPLI